MVSKYIGGIISLSVLVYFWVCVFRYWWTTPPDDPGTDEAISTEEWRKVA
jgi:hypothetical protein